MRKVVIFGLLFGASVPRLWAGWGYEYMNINADPSVAFLPLDANPAQSLWQPGVTVPRGRWSAASSAWLGGTYLGSFHWSPTPGIQVHLVGLWSGTMDETDASGRVVGTFSTQHLYLGETFQRPLGAALTLGLGAGLYAQSIGGKGSLALGGQVGLRWQAPNRPLQVAVALANLGVEIKPMEQQRFHPAPQLRLVVRYAPGTAVDLSAGAVASPVGSWIHLAGRYQLTPLLGVALAYTTQWNALKLGDPNDFLIGLMPGVDLTWRRLRLTYAFGPLAAVGDLHLLSLSFR